MRSRGKTQNKTRPKSWTDREDQILIDLYPDYSSICRRIRGRTRLAIITRVQYLGIANKRHTWTTREVSLLRKLYPILATQQVYDALPGLNRDQLKSMIYRLRLRKIRPPFKSTGFPLVDAVRARAGQLSLTMPQLDVLARTQPYFKSGAWESNVHSALLRAIYALGGEISIVWEEG